MYNATIRKITIKFVCTKIIFFISANTSIGVTEVSKNLYFVMYLFIGKSISKNVPQSKIFKKKANLSFLKAKTITEILIFRIFEIKIV